MDKLINEIEIKELMLSDIKIIHGGGPILEGIAWLYGFAHGRTLRMADNMDWNEVDWEKMRSLYE
jgi:hypothetical protein